MFCHISRIIGQNSDFALVYSFLNRLTLEYEFTEFDINQWEKVRNLMLSNFLAIRYNKTTTLLPRSSRKHFSLWRRLPISVHFLLFQEVISQMQEILRGNDLKQQKNLNKQELQGSQPAKDVWKRKSWCIYLKYYEILVKPVDEAWSSS